MLVTFDGIVGEDLEYKMEQNDSEFFPQYKVYVKDLDTGLTYKGDAFEMECETDLAFGHFAGRRKASITLRNPVVVEVKQ